MLESQKVRHFCNSFQIETKNILFFVFFNRVFNLYVIRLFPFYQGT